MVRTAIHGVDAAAAGIDGQALHIGAGRDRRHRSGGAAHDSDEPQVWKRRVGLPRACIDDDAFGALGNADLSARRRSQVQQDDRQRNADTRRGCRAARRDGLFCSPFMTRLRFALPLIALLVAGSLALHAEQTAPARPKILAFLTSAGELDHVL